MAFRVTDAALRRSLYAPRQWKWVSAILTVLPSVGRTSGTLLCRSALSGSRVIQENPIVTRPFSTLLGNGAAPRRSKPVTTAESVITLSPRYQLYPDDVHCFVGLNGSGKTQFLAKLQDHVKAQQAKGELPASCRLASLSLDAHREFVAENGHRVVADVLGGIGSPTARDLIVRLGLYPVWEQRVHHLSTGEMRKLLLAVALLETPRASVLILDQPFDGLDVKARRQLQWMLGQLTRGFTRLLVETTGAKHEAFAYKTQVLLVANRLEQVFPEIFSHTVLLKQGGENEDGFEVVAWPEDKEDDARNKAMMQKLKEFYDEEYGKRVRMEDADLVSLVKKLFNCQDGEQIKVDIPAVQLNGVSISYDRKRILLEDVDFVRQTHEHWVLLGPNGSGKSSLMRVLMQTPGHGLTEGEVFVVGELVRSSESDAITHSKPRLEAISTDQHIQLLHKSLQAEGAETQTAFSLIESNAESPEAAKLAMNLLELPDAVKTRTLSELSQGEQKLVLIARALAAQPKLLILDEITHGLDPFNRAHVLRVIEAIGQHVAQRTHMVLITHHEDEITPCFSSIFEIQDRQLVERPRQLQTQEQTA
ncbi:putative molybdenum transport ATP-binding protein ModF [Phytophthora citrophthora]|uniref:Molybdenum transport ATP-binding protein ModF n=1 Tax=Phytophthora citrophthora TaxID=4793 RepID=A0AAD9GG99_9STRA|nr:putative molybdenum transport ATP-binding protein ModF [Phytophthora citrophthora]